MIHSETSKAIFEDAADGTGWGRAHGAGQAGEPQEGNTTHTESPRHVPVPAQPWSGLDPVTQLHSRASIHGPALPRASRPCSWFRSRPELGGKNPSCGSREGLWLSVQFLWKCLYGIKCIHFCSEVFPSGKWEKGG